MKKLVKNLLFITILTLIAMSSLTMESENVQHFVAAIIEGNLEAVKKITAADSYIINKQIDEFSPLYFAIMKGHTEIAKFLLAAGANKDSPTKKYNFFPLHFAAILNNIEIVKLLLAAGANKNSQVENGETPLHFAALNGHTEIVKLLLTAKANAYLQNKNGFDPFGTALKRNHKEIARLLLAAPDSIVRDRANSE